MGSQTPESAGPNRWHVHCFTDFKKIAGKRVMVEFVRDVMIAVALLATVIAVAVHPGQEAEPLTPGNGAVIGVRLPVALEPGVAPAGAVQAK